MYQALISMNQPVRLRIKNGDSKGIVPLDVYTLDSEGSDPCLVKRITSTRPMMDQVLSLGGYPVTVMLALHFSPVLAEYAPVHEAGSGGGASDEQVQQVMFKVEEQQQVNANQQKEIDANTKAHEENLKVDELQQKEIDELKTPMTEAEVQQTWDSVFGDSQS